MIIKNSVQLKHTKNRQKNILKEIESYKEYKGIQREFLVPPLKRELQKIEQSIKEYNQLTKLPFKQSVRDVLNKPILIDNIGDLLAKLRVANKMTQAEMAKELGWKQSNLSRFESENYSSQTIRKIVELATELDIHLLVAPSLTENFECKSCMEKANENPLEKNLAAQLQEKLSSQANDIQSGDANQPTNVTNSSNFHEVEQSESDYEAHTSIFQSPLIDLTNV